MRFLKSIREVLFISVLCGASIYGGMQYFGITDSDGDRVEVTSDGQLHVALVGKPDANNSMTATMAIDEVYTGTASDLSVYGAITILITVTEDSATDGLAVQFSSDGVGWYSGESYTILAGATKFFTPPVQAKYYRITYTNDGTESDVHIHTMLKKQSVKSSSHNLQGDLNDEDDAELIVSVLKLRTAANTYVSGTATMSGNFKISLEEIETEANLLLDTDLTIARGIIPGAASVNKYGRAMNGIQLTDTDIWDRADESATQQIWLAPTAARLHAIASSSDLDGKTASPSSVGARTIRLWGLNTWSTKESSEDIILDGTTPVNTASSYVIIHRMKMLTHGSSGPNVGDITATSDVDGTVTAQISAGQGQTNMAILGIPSTQVGYMTNYDVNAHNTGNPSTITETDISFLVNESPDVDPSSSGFLNKSNTGMIAVGSSVFTKIYSPYKKVPGPAIIKFQGISTLADTEGVAEFDIILIDN